MTIEEFKEFENVVPCENAFFVDEFVSIQFTEYKYLDDKGCGIEVYWIDKYGREIECNEIRRVIDRGLLAKMVRDYDAISPGRKDFNSFDGFTFEIHLAIGNAISRGIHITPRVLDYYNEGEIIFKEYLEGMR